MTLKLEMLSGLPASGKSTYAKEKINKDRSWARVNRDDLRQMLFGGKWSPYNEKITIETEKSIAAELLGFKRHVIIDDTNLGPKHESMWRGFCEDFNSINELQVEFQKTEFNTPVEECISRDYNRLEQVGRNVIAKMAARYGKIQWPDKPIVLVDIDGTLANGEHREYLVHQEPKKWDEYLDLAYLDEPVEAVFKWVAELAKENTIVIVSGRGAEREYLTYQWFEKMWTYGRVPRFPVFQYFFRNKGDRRPDDIVKLEVLDLLPKKPVLVIDDRPSVIRAWRSKGLKVIPVRGSIDEF